LLKNGKGKRNACGKTVGFAMMQRRDGDICVLARRWLGFF
jgi:hypothetical protein